MFIRTSHRYKFKQLIITLAFSAFASLCMAANTHAAGTADVKADFGAVGDGIADDSDAINNAFGSDYTTIIIPEGQYRITKQITFAKGDKTILAEKATIFGDNDFVKPTYQGAHNRLLLINEVNNITIKGLRLDARQSSSPTTPFNGLAAIAHATGIHFDSCSFTSDPALTNSMVIAIDFFTDWHNISVTNSHFRMLHDRAKDTGGNVMLRNFSSTNPNNAVHSNNAIFTNNTMYKFGGDEIFWIALDQATGSITDVEVSSNRFYFGDSTTNVYTIATRAYAPDQIKNVNFHNNEVIGNGSNKAIVLEGVENFDITNNDIYTKVSYVGAPIDVNGVPTTLYSGGIFGSRDDASDSPITTDTVTIHHNRTLSLDSEFIVSGVTSGSRQPYHVYDNPHITINAPTTNLLVNHKGRFASNNIIVNGDVKIIIGGTTKDLQNNHILIDGYANTFLENYDSDLTAPATYTGNHFTTTQKRPNPSQDPGAITRLIMMHDFTMNSHPITIRDNTFINGSTTEDDTSLELFTVPNTGSNTVTDRTPTTPRHSLWQVLVEDPTPASQTVTICNNHVQGFRTIATSARTPAINLTCN